ncbi:MAG: hypothetical protein ISP91_11615 [Pseudomonadales bacterium]|nr:hypothetical protein [Pseudomonadales bacterium]
MNWRKQGLIFTTDRRLAHSRSHAQLPLLDIETATGNWRIYFATRDEQNRSTISFIEVEPGEPKKIKYVHDRPLIQLGALGTFDEFGTMPLSLVSINEDTKYLYYAGWSRKFSIPYHNAIGLAVSHDGGKTFEKAFPGPLLDARRDEPHFTGTCCVRKEESHWKMWYQSCTKWEILDGHPEPYYHLKYAESSDGVIWERHGHVAIDYASDTEGGICAATVIKDSDYRMWYCYRKARNYREDPTSSYRIGYAESIDGKNWQRMDKINTLTTGPDQWDDHMVCYPNVNVIGDDLFMFYNGNGFGATGFGYAISNYEELDD